MATIDGRTASGVLPGRRIDFAWCQRPAEGRAGWLLRQRWQPVSPCRQHLRLRGQATPEELVEIHPFLVFRTSGASAARGPDTPWRVDRSQGDCRAGAGIVRDRLAGAGGAGEVRLGGVARAGAEKGTSTARTWRSAGCVGEATGGDAPSCNAALLCALGACGGVGREVRRGLHREQGRVRNHLRGGRAAVRALSVHCLPGSLSAVGRSGGRAGPWCTRCPLRRPRREPCGHRGQVVRRVAVSRARERDLAGKPRAGLPRLDARRGRAREMAKHLRHERLGF